MTNYQINGQKATADDFKQLVQILNDVGYQVAVPSKDKNLTGEEITHLFASSNHDPDSLTLADFSSFGNQNINYFYNVHSLLEKYGYHIEEHVQADDWSEFHDIYETKNLPPELLNDKKIALAALKHDGFLLKYFSDSIKNDDAIVLAAVSNYPPSIREASDRLQSNINFLLKVVDAIKDNPNRYYLNDLIPDPKIRQKVSDEKIIKNGGKLQDIDQLSSEGWNKLISYCEQKGYVFPGSHNSHDTKSFFENLKNIGFTQFPERFTSVEQIAHLWTNRVNVQQYTKLPVALIIANESDWNGAFQNDKLAHALGDNEHFYTLYYETHNTDEYMKAFDEATRDGTRTIHTFVEAGHGTKNSAILGPDASIGEITVESIKNQYHDKLADYLRRTKQVLLYSCSNGEGGQDEDNLANTFASILPPNATVFSTQIPSNIESITVNSDLTLNIKWDGNKPYDATGGFQYVDKSTLGYRFEKWSSSLVGSLYYYSGFKFPWDL